MSDLRTTQRRALQLGRLLWPGETLEEAALALTEEASEVGRAVIKRNHARRGEGTRPGSVTGWTANLRRELAQTVVVAAKIAEAEGFDLAEAVRVELDALVDQAERKGLL